MSNLVGTDRVRLRADTSESEGRVVWLPLKTIWLFAHAGLGLSALFYFPELDAVLVFIVLTAVTICLGHSVGMHRLLIHRSFETFLPVEHILVWLGTGVGMAGPIGMIKAHDMRDWHQRQSRCPPHPAHAAGFLKDAWWQLCCEFRLTFPPEFICEPRVLDDRFYRFIERFWMLQQIPIALLLYCFGGWAWVLWGISMRIVVSLVGRAFCASARATGLDCKGFASAGV